MQKWTLRQLCECCGVTRRAVQGYERNGLVRPIGKTDRGYLLYDLAAKKRVAKVRRLQNYGFSVKEIVLFFDATSEERTAMLAKKLAQLRIDREKCTRYIQEIEVIIAEEKR